MCQQALFESTHPCILANFEQFQRTVRHKRVVVFLDYDGTLTPIVSNPDEAFMSPAMRATVRSLAELFPTAIISGRGRSKVEGFVQLPELFYAGSHGLDIKGPVVKTEGGEAEVLPLNLAGDLLTTMAAVRDEARAAVRAIAGAHVEDNKFSVSVHFRNCSPADWDEVRCSVEAIAARWRDVHVTRGRKVLELRPQVAWDKGRALLHLLEALALHEEPDVLPIYIGDDRTDEDAFGVLRGRGVGILVSSIPKVTAAAYTLRDPEQVGRFLVQLAEWGANSPDNGWLREPSCVGWACRANSSDSGGSVTSAQGL